MTNITVAVATCGRPQGLLRCLRALATGTRVPAQVIVVDQSPSDESRGAASECARHVDTTYVEQQRRGLSASRNLALSLATHPILAVTDDDCVPQPGWVSAIASAFEVFRPSAVTGPVGPLGPQPPGMYAVSLRHVTVAQTFVGRMPPWRAGTGGNFAGLTVFLRDVGGWNEGLGVGSRGLSGEDAEMLYRLLRAGGVVRYDPAVEVLHEWQPLERRMATRWSYGHGIGAMCGIWLRRRDWYAARMLATYARVHAAALARAVVACDADVGRQHVTALRSLLPGLIYGYRTGHS